MADAKVCNTCNASQVLDKSSVSAEVPSGWIRFMFKGWTIEACSLECAISNLTVAVVSLKLNMVRHND